MWNGHGFISISKSFDEIFMIFLRSIKAEFLKVQGKESDFCLWLIQKMNLESLLQAFYVN
jgi:hypothetical protein